jgi:hypothetical protein
VLHEFERNVASRDVLDPCVIAIAGKPAPTGEISLFARFGGASSRVGGAGRPEARDQP